MIINYFKTSNINEIFKNMKNGEIYIGNLTIHCYQFDTNQKGKISQMEFFNALCDITKEKFNKEEVREMFLNIDTNKNNYIEPEEFVKAAVDKKIFMYFSPIFQAFISLTL